jgi:putative tryptophan/tyrosine transport system substrate-binding protein
MRTRRELLDVFIGWLLAMQVRAARAQAKIPRVGLLAAGSAHPRPRPIEALIEALRDLGYVEGRTIQIEYRWAEGRPERLDALAADLVRVNVDLIVASGDAAIRAARQASRMVPIVMATSGDAVSAGFVESLARPGGNVTGMTAITPELSAKRLQILKELLPRVSRVAVLWNPTDTVQALDWSETQSAARSLGMSLQSIEFRTPSDVDRALAALAQSPPEALVVFNATETVERRAQLVEVTSMRRIPAVYDASEWVVAGGLVAYGVTHASLFRRSATFIDRILKGAKPADLPVEQPTAFLLAINAKTAQALNLTIPQSLLLRADEVIQ